MPPEEKELLVKSVLLAEDNNRILHSMNRSLIWGRVFKFIYWMFIIGSAIGAYYYIEPYLDKMMDLYDSVSNTQQQLNETAGSVQNMLNLPDALLKKFTN